MADTASRAVEIISAVRHYVGRSVFAEAMISALVSVVLFIGVVWNLPESEVKRQLTPVLRPVASAAGLEQGWRMYAPEPIRRLEVIEVHVTMSDGNDRMWVNPSGDKVIGSFAWYHWQKLKECLPREPKIRAGVAHWVVRELTAPSEKPVRVQIIMRTELLPPPGADGPRTTAVETLYDENLEGRP